MRKAVRDPFVVGSIAHLEIAMTKDSKDEQMASKGSTWLDRITLLPLEDQKRLSNWRIFSTNISLQPTKDSPTSADSEQDQTSPESREPVSQE